MTGSGTLLDPYVIYDVNDLQAMENDLDAYYELANDIDASATIGWNAGAGFNPVGTFTPYDPFTGQLDGKDYTISDLFINRPAAETVGLFGIIAGDNAKISKLTLENPSFTGMGSDGYVGGLTGLANYLDTPGYVEEIQVIDCHVVGGNITQVAGIGFADLGGLIGVILTGVIVSVEDSDFAGTLTSQHDAPSVGGLVGWGVGRIVIDNCHSSGTISATSAGILGGVGGLIGVQAATNCQISNSYSSCIINSTSYYVGGLIGNIYGGVGITHSISDCYASGNVTGNGIIGGLIGAISISAMAGVINIQNSYASGNVISAGSGSSIGGFIGGISTVGTITITDCYATGDIDCTSDASVGDVGGFIGDLGIATISRCYSTGNTLGTAGDTGELRGGFIGKMRDGDIDECFAIGDVEGGNFCGGFVGFITDGAVTNCYSRGDVSTTYTPDPDIGGFVADNRGVIENCYSTGLVNPVGATDFTYVGGFCGDNTGGGGGTITNCFWDTQTSGWVTSDGGTGKTTTEMKTTATFTDAGWDFTTIWGRFSYCNDGYPCLQAVTPNCAARARGYKGNILIDQLIFQHCERMKR